MTCEAFSGDPCYQKCSPQGSPNGFDGSTVAPARRRKGQRIPEKIPATLNLPKVCQLASTLSSHFLGLGTVFPGFVLRPF